jgi:pimeloyl-ACP methyl ester carboxylesterase
LIGNPGEGIDYAYYVQYLFANIFAERDVIIIDQRGTGFSQPSFDCPEFDAVSYETETQNLSIQQSNSKYVEASRTCVNRVKASAANLQDYTTAATAADLEELRLALGYTQWNLYSFYDGSQLALTMMREYPGSIRSVIMDSAIPLQANPQAEWGDHVELAFNRLFETCAENEQCNEAFPKLKSSFYALLDKLDTQPISVDVADLNSGVQYTVMLDSDRLIAFIMNLLPDIDGTAIPEIPRMIYQLQDGKTEAVARLWGSHPLWSDGNSAMAQWLYCSEETYFTTPEQVDKANENLNHHLREYANNSWEGTFQACEEWGGWGVPDIENQSVTSDIPTLLLTGELNWYASTAYIELISQTLNNSTQVVFPGVGQIISITYAGAWAECSKKIVDSFLETPGAGQDTSCASKPAKLLWVTFP